MRIDKLYVMLAFQFPLILAQFSSIDFKFLSHYLNARYFRAIAFVQPINFTEELRNTACEFSRKGVHVSVSDFPTSFHASSLNVLEFNNNHREFAASVLIRASDNNVLNAGRHWLIMTDAANLQELYKLLSTLHSYVDSDLVVGINYEDKISLEEVYNTGMNGEQVVINLGNWTKHSSNISSLSETLHLPTLKVYKYHRRENLRGVKFRIGVVNVNKMYCITIQDEQNKTKMVGGYAGSIFNLIEKNLNFSSDIHILPGYAYGLYTKENDSWSGLVGELQRREIDMTGCEVSPTPERQRHLEFSQPFHIIGRRIYYKRPDKEFHADAFLRPFSGDIWAVLTVTLPAVAGLAYLLGWCSPLRARHEMVDSYGNHFFGLLSALLSQGWPGVYTDTPRRALLWTAMVTYLVISVSYSAKMVAIRTAEKPTLPIRTLEDVYDRSDWDFGFVAAALERNYFEGADSSSIMGKLWQQIERKAKKSLVLDVKAGLDRVLSRKFVFLGFHWSCQNILQNQFTDEQACQLQVINKDYFKGGTAFGLQKESPYQELIDYRILRMRQTGVLDRMAKQSLPKLPNCADSPFSMINVIDVAPALMLLGCGIVASLLILTLEIIWNRRNQRKLKQKWAKISNSMLYQDKKLLPINQKWQ